MYLRGEKSQTLTDISSKIPARGGIGMGRPKPKTILEPHRHEVIFIVRGKEDLLVTKNMVPGESVYGGGKRIDIEVKHSINRRYLMPMNREFPKSNTECGTTSVPT
jgi:hypothetical protein